MIIIFKVKQLNYNQNRFYLIFGSFEAYLALLCLLNSVINYRIKYIKEEILGIKRKHLYLLEQKEAIDNALLLLVFS
ncbi:hypothetical protein AS361_03375 [Myroides marinus]|nr:hypothetical protein AS361_03375 [Myroides marinus]